MKNGRTKAAAISAISALALASIALGSYYTGWRGRVGAEVLREERVSNMLESAEKIGEDIAVMEARSAVVGGRVDSLELNVRTLIESQERTNEKLDRLTQTLMDYLAAQTRRTGPAR